QGAYDDPLRELDLELVDPGGFCIGERRRCRTPKWRLTGAGLRQDLLRRAGPPRLRGNPAQRQPRLLDYAPLQLARRSSGPPGEGVGGSFTDFQIASMGCKIAGLARQPQGDDQIARLKRVVSIGPIAGQAVKAVDRDLASTASTLDFHDGVERDE